MPPTAQRHRAFTRSRSVNSCTVAFHKLPALKIPSNLLLDHNAWLRSGPQPGMPPAPSYPTLARLCYKRCAVNSVAQRAGASDLRGDSRLQAGGEARGDATETAGREGRAFPEEKSTNSHVALTVAGEDASRYCPACSERLESRRCKLICSICGYYMSCADYY